MCRGECQGKLESRGREKEVPILPAILTYQLICCFVFYISHQNVSSLRPENLSYFLLSPQCLAYCPAHGGWPMNTWWMLLNKYGPPLGPWRQVAVQPQRKGVCREFEESHTVRLCVVSLEPVTCSIANLHPTPSLVHIKTEEHKVQTRFQHTWPVTQSCTFHPLLITIHLKCLCSYTLRPYIHFLRLRADKVENSRGTFSAEHTVCLSGMGKSIKKLNCL